MIENQDMQIANYFQQFPYPHCRKATTLSSLRTGVAIAQVLTDKLPSSLHHLFLPLIQIYNPNTQRCLLNLKVLLQSLRVFAPNLPLNEYTPQGLYFDHNMMQSFLTQVLIPLDGELGQQSDNIDIANLSSIMVNAQYRDAPKKVIVLPELSQQVEQNEDEQQDQQILDALKMKISKWLWESHHVDLSQSPDRILGQAVNSIFAGSRLDGGKIVKPSHYQLGGIVAMRKAGQYLLTCERMAKQNVLSLLQDIENGEIREEIFWAVLEDLMDLRTSHHRKTSNAKRIASQHSTTPAQTLPQSRALKPVQPVIKPKETKPRVEEEYNMQIVKLAEEWIGGQLGYEHSLNKSRTAKKVAQSPLLNGVLLGSVVMRMQIGKVNTIKQPTTAQQVQRNIGEVANCLIRRGVEAGRKLLSLPASYRNYLGVIWDAKIELQRKSQLDKGKRAEQAKANKVKSMTQEQMKEISEWLTSKGKQVENFPYLPASLVSQVCGQALQLRLLRETTPRIRYTNMTKVIEELRRLGWETSSETNEILSEQGVPIRWEMLRFVRELLQHRVYYFR